MPLGDTFWEYVSPPRLSRVDSDVAEVQAWIDTGIGRLEAYLAKWAEFQRLYPEAA